MALEHTLDTPLAKAVRAKRSQSAFARLIGKSQSFVHGLLRDGKPLPAEYVLLVEADREVAAESVSKYDLRPDLFQRDTLPAPDPDPLGFEHAR